MDQPRQIWRIVPAPSRADLLRQCRRAIQSGLVFPGDRLPNEREIARLSGLSRSTVRIVLGQLEQDGLIVRQVGRGTYVGDRGLATAGGEMGERPTPAELMEFRLVVEPSLIELAVLAATDAQLDDLSTIARFGRRVTQWREAEEADRRFHQAIFNAGGNPLFAELGQRLSAARDSRAWLLLKEGSFSIDKWSIYQSEHEAIVAALRDRNAEAAKAALRRHLSGVRATARALAWEL